MRVRTKLLGLAGIVLIICGVAAWQVHLVYYFSPLTFKRDTVTSEHWKEYKRPVELDVVYQSFYAASSRYTTENRREINYVLSQLKAGQPDIAYKSSRDIGQTGQIWMQFRDPVSGEDYIDAILRHNMKVALLGQTNPVTVTSGIKQFVLGKRKYAKIIN